MIGAGETEEAALWQDVECGGYAVDLPRLTELARSAAGSVVELGAGTGRVALELARAGIDVIAVERDAGLAAALARRADERRPDPQPRVVVADAAEADLDPGSVDLVLAPMQFLHLLDAASRAVLFARIRGWLRRGGRLGAVILAETAEAIAGASDDAPPLPDVREADGWVLSSLPLAVRAEPGRVAIERLRQSVSPTGELSETRAVDVLWDLTADGLVAEASVVGLVEVFREPLPGDDLHVDSTLVVLERP